jgi:hypothetical protein
VRAGVDRVRFVLVGRRGGLTASYRFSFRVFWACRSRLLCAAGALFRPRLGAVDDLLLFLRSGGSPTWTWPGNGTVTGCGTPTGERPETSCRMSAPSMAIRSGSRWCCVLRSPSSSSRSFGPFRLISIVPCSNRYGRHSYSTACRSIAGNLRFHVRLLHPSSADRNGSNRQRGKNGPLDSQLLGSADSGAPPRRDGLAVATARAFGRF